MDTSGNEEMKSNFFGVDPNQHTDRGRKVSTPSIDDGGGVHPTTNGFGSGRRRQQQQQQQRQQEPVDANSRSLEGLSRDFGFLLNNPSTSDCYLDVRAAIDQEYNTRDDRTKAQLETEEYGGKIKIFIRHTDPQIMKEVVIFLYTAKCDLERGTIDH
ncbi:unnamed protein product, partial [Didymodactylos carnosus]